MLSIKKRAAKCVHYYQTNSYFKEIFANNTIYYIHMLEKIKKKFSDLEISDREIEMFWKGLWLTNSFTYKDNYFFQAAKNIEK